MADQGFAIPTTDLDILNKVFRKEASISIREEQPERLVVAWGDFEYLGVPVKRITRLILTYPSPKPVEIYNVTYTDEGNVSSINLVV